MFSQEFLGQPQTVSLKESRFVFSVSPVLAYRCSILDGERRNAEEAAATRIPKRIVGDPHPPTTKRDCKVYPVLVLRLEYSHLSVLYKHEGKMSCMIGEFVQLLHR
jgi:hypothetical protein